MEELFKLQRALNAAARMITGTRAREHITPVLKSLHWLNIPERIEFKIALLVYKSTSCNGPQYLRDLLVFYTPDRNLRSKDAQLLTKV